MMTALSYAVDMKEIFKCPPLTETPPDLIVLRCNHLKSCLSNLNLYILAKKSWGIFYDENARNAGLVFDLQLFDGKEGIF